MKINIIIFLIMNLCVYGNYLVFAQTIDTIFHTGNSPITYNTVNTVITDEQNNLWIGTEYGLNRFDKNGWLHWFAENSNLPNDAIRSLTIDNKKNIWIGTTDSDYLAYYNKDSILLFEKPQSFKDFIRDIIFLENENDTLMAIATPSGLGLYDLKNQNWEIYNLNYPYVVSPHFTSIAYSNEGGVYAGTINGGLFNIQKNGNIRVLVGEESGLADNTILDVAIDSTGLIWLAMPEGGLGNFNGDKFEIFNPENSEIPSRSIACLAIESPTEIWCGTFDTGIVKFSTTGVTVFDTMNSPLLSNKINYLHIQNDSILWAATDMGLARIRLTDNELSNINLSNTLNKTIAYPNPGNGYFKLNYSYYKGDIIVFDINGEMVYQTSDAHQHLNLSHLNKGTYLLNIQTKQNNFIQKIVIL